jgi:hypothetical protein
MEPGDGLITQKYWVTKLLEGWWVGGFFWVGFTVVNYQVSQ